MSDTPQIPGADLVVQHFGYWPSFHDAEVHWVRLDRNGPTLEFAVHAFEMTDKVDDRGFYVLTKHCLVVFRHREFSEMRLDGFNHQNAIFGIEVENLREEGWEQDWWKLTIDPAHGVAAEVIGVHLEVVSLIPCDPKGVPSEA